MGGAQDDAGAVLVLVGPDEVKGNTVAVRDAPWDIAQAVLPLVRPSALAVARHAVAKGAVGDLAEVEEPYAGRIGGKDLFDGLRRMLRKPGRQSGDNVGVGFHLRIRRKCGGTANGIRCFGVFTLA